MIQAKQRQRQGQIEFLEFRRLLATVTAPDLTFGSNGSVNAEAGVYLTTLSNGDVLAIGTLDTQAITKLLPNGKPDPSFGNAGGVSLTGSYDTKLAALTADNIFTYGIISEDTTRQELRAVSLSTGVLDTGFGKKGREPLPVQAPDGKTLSSSSVSNISATPDGGLLVSINLQLSDSTTQNQLVKLALNGRVDTTFATGGYLTLPGNDVTSAATWTSNGIVVVDTGNSSGNVSLTRYTSAGVLDQSFGTGGSVSAPAISGDQLLEESDGRLLLLQGENFFGDQTDVVRFTASGVLDKTFGTKGVFQLPDELSDNGQHAIDVDPSGRIDIVMDTSAIRLTSSGQLDTSFGHDGSYALNFVEANPSTIATDASGNVLVGTFETVMRLQTGPAVSLQPNGELLVRGTSANDVLTVTQASALVNVTLNGKSSSYDSTKVTGVDVDAGDGHNDISIALDVPCDVLGGGDDDTITTGGGDDTIVAGEGNDSISSGAGNDNIDGGFGDSTILAGDGDDTITTTVGDETIDLGAGKDQATLNEPSTLDMTGGAGKKFIDLRNAINISIKLGTGGSLIEDDEDFGGTQSIRIAGGSNTVDIDDSDFNTGKYNISIGGAGDNLVNTGDGASTVSTGDGNDTINLYGPDSVQAGGGNDLVQIGGDNIGACTINGGDGNDRLIPGDGPDLIFGGNGNDYIRTGTGNDSLYGGGGSDTIRAGGGNDYLSGGGGRDHLFGQQGKDRLYGGNGDDILNGGPGNDRLDGGAGSDYLAAGPGNDTLTANDGVVDSVYGGDGNDSASIDAGIDILRSIEAS